MASHPERSTQRLGLDLTGCWMAWRAERMPPLTGPARVGLASRLRRDRPNHQQLLIAQSVSPHSGLSPTENPVTQYTSIARSPSLPPLEVGPSFRPHPRARQLPQELTGSRRGS